MALEANEIERIYVELLLGLPREKSLVRSRPEVDKFRVSLAAEIAQMRAAGKQFAIPGEFPDVLSSAGTELRYDPSQPRGEDGRWSSSGGGVGDIDDDDYHTESVQPWARKADFQVENSTITDAQADQIASRIRAKEAAFAQSGGRVEDAKTSPKALQQAKDDLDDTTEWIQDDNGGLEMARDALGYGDVSGMRVEVARAGEVHGQKHLIAGAAAYNDTPRTIEGDLVSRGRNGYLGFNAVGTTGLADGVGSVMYGRVVRHAASRGSGIALEPLDENAASFWAAQGFTTVLDLDDEVMMYLNKESVQKIASRL